MIQIFFDTNVWIDYCLNSHISKKRLRNKKKIIPINRINSRLAKVTITDPLLYEITAHFKDFYLLKSAINRGYSIAEFNRVKRDFILRPEDRKRVDNIFQKVISYTTTKDQYFYNWLDEKTLDFVFKLTNQYDVEFIDCLHFVSALLDKCNVFVTKDTKLISAIQKASRKFKTFRKLEILQPKEFISNYSTKIMKK